MKRTVSLLLALALLLGLAACGSAGETVIAPGAEDGGSNPTSNCTCVTTDASLVPEDRIILIGPDLGSIRATPPLRGWCCCTSTTSAATTRRPSVR